jgi:ACS family hexuronate transporter-like MFS transporter
MNGTGDGIGSRGIAGEGRGMSGERGRRRFPFRWAIAILLFCSTTINYISRQTLSQAAPFLERDLHISSRQYGDIAFWFLIVYAAMPIVAGRLLDRFGTKLVLAVAVVWWSVAGMLHAVVHSVTGFKVLRAMLAAGEGVNWPGATKAVSEWFPAGERSLAVGIFDSGSSVGAIIAATAVMALIVRDWRWAFVATGVLGFAWLYFWLRYYGDWQTSRHVGDEERRAIARSHADAEGALAGPPLPWPRLLRFKQVWGVMVGRICSDAVWWFLVFWLTKYLLQSRRVSVGVAIAVNWIPYLCADAGNFGGGGVSALLVKRGWSLTRARRSVLLVAGLVMTLVVPGALLRNTGLSLAAISLWALFYAAFSTILLALPSDLFEPRVVGSVAGITQTGAGIGGALFQLLAGYFVQQTSGYTPIFWMASALSLLGTIAVLLLVPRVEILDGGSKPAAA